MGEGLHGVIGERGGITAVALLVTTPPLLRDPELVLTKCLQVGVQELSARTLCDESVGPDTSIIPQPG
jgi:hypothetical protein